MKRLCERKSSECHCESRYDHPKAPPRIREYCDRNKKYGASPHRGCKQLVCAPFPPALVWNVPGRPQHRANKRTTSSLGQPPSQGTRKANRKRVAKGIPIKSSRGQDTARHEFQGSVFLRKIVKSRVVAPLAPTVTQG